MNALEIDPHPQSKQCVIAAPTAKLVAMLARIYEVAKYGAPRCSILSQLPVPSSLMIAVWL